MNWLDVITKRAARKLAIMRWESITALSGTAQAAYSHFHIPTLSGVTGFRQFSVPR
jgi:hypothetical protein